MWWITVSTAGETRRNQVSEVRENLAAIHAVQAGIRARTIAVGQKWQDTVYELTTAQVHVSTLECIGAANSTSSKWVFEIHDDFIQLPTRLELDTLGRVLIKEIPPLFTARREEGLSPSGNPPKVNFSEVFHISAQRAPTASVHIALALPPETALHESVTAFYQKSGKLYMLQSPAGACKEILRSEYIDTSDLFLQPTVTIQSGHKRIRTLAESLTAGMHGVCTIITMLNRYVDGAIENRDVATFSSALETLNAGFGDCGEHAVLLAALLRASGGLCWGWCISKLVKVITTMPGLWPGLGSGFSRIRHWEYIPRCRDISR
jgi:hypothetical protein